MKKKLILPVLLLAATALFSSCERDVVGPQGPQGPQGPAGADANVAGTNTVTVGWTFDNNSNTYTATMNVPGITQNVVDYGSVEVFIQYGNEWWVLPDVIGINSTTYGFDVGYVNLVNSNSDGSAPAYPSHSTFRVVIISESARMANPEVNWKSYSDVKAGLHLAN